MLTPCVTGFVFAKCVTAVSMAVVLATLRLITSKKKWGEPLTRDEPTPTQISGRAGGAGRPFDIDELSKEGIYELPPAA